MIDDPTKLYKMIQENEIKEGYKAKMDKKSLMRILSKLGKDGQIKNITVELELEEKTKVDIQEIFQFENLIIYIIFYWERNKLLARIFSYKINRSFHFIHKRKNRYT